MYSDWGKDCFCNHLTCSESATSTADQLQATSSTCKYNQIYAWQTYAINSSHWDSYNTPIPLSTEVSFPDRGFHQRARRAQKNVRARWPLRAFIRPTKEHWALHLHTIGGIVWSQFRGWPVKLQLSALDVSCVCRSALSAMIHSSYVAVYVCIRSFPWLVCTLRWAPFYRKKEYKEDEAYLAYLWYR